MHLNSAQFLLLIIIFLALHNNVNKKFQSLIHVIPMLAANSKKK